MHLLARLRIADSSWASWRRQDALALAQEKGLDLVEVAPNAVPPVCRILDYGQYKYEIQKREREAKKKQKSQTFKEIRLRVKIDTNDLRTKTRRAAEFLEEGDRVKVTVQFRGREMTHAQPGARSSGQGRGMLTEHGTIERPPLLEGRNMYIVMAPIDKRAEKKTESGEARPPRPAGARPPPTATRPSATHSWPGDSRSRAGAGRGATATSGAVTQCRR